MRNDQQKKENKKEKLVQVQLILSQANKMQAGKADRVKAVRQMANRGQWQFGKIQRPFYGTWFYRREVPIDETNFTRFRLSFPVLAAPRRIEFVDRPIREI